MHRLEDKLHLGSRRPPSRRRHNLQLIPSPCMGSACTWAPSLSSSPPLPPTSHLHTLSLCLSLRDSAARPIARPKDAPCVHIGASRLLGLGATCRDNRCYTGGEETRVRQGRESPSGKLIRTRWRCGARSQRRAQPPLPADEVFLLV